MALALCKSYQITGISNGMSFWEKIFPSKKGELFRPQEKPYPPEETKRMLEGARARFEDLNREKQEIQRRIEEGTMPDVNRKNLEDIEKKIEGQREKIVLLEGKRERGISR